MPPPPLLLWTPSDIETIDKNSDYSVSLSDVPLQVTSLTPFLDNGLRVKINGTRLYYLIKNKDLYANSTKTTSSSPQNNRGFKSHKNVCFLNAATKGDVVSLMQSKLNLPDCMQRFLADFQIRSRGKRFRKRFIFNAYVANVLTCTKCNKMCLLKAMSLLYNHDDKCVQEFDRLVFRNSNLYKPPNCENVKNKDKLCFKTGMCKGSNPICNF